MARHAEEPMAALRPEVGEEGFSLLYQTTYRRALYLTGDRATAEDAAQETFCRYLARRPANLANPAAWLLTVCTRLCFDWMKRGRRRAAQPLDAAYAVSDPQPLPEQVVSRQEDLALARAALDRLEPRDRMMLLLRYSSASYREIAAQAGCAESSVGQLLHRAERRFRSAYADLSGSHSSR